MTHHLQSAPRSHALLCAAALMFAPVAVFAGGMALSMQNGSQLGSAYSGGAAAEDASTVYYNPAGLLWLDHPETLASFVLISPSGGFTNNGSVTAGTIPTTGGNGGAVGDSIVIPTFYVGYPVSDRLALGFGISVPYGLATSYDADWVGRYHAIKSRLTTLDLSPAIAWRPVEKVSVGFGLDWQHVNATLTNAVDFGLIGFLNTVPGMLPGGADGGLRVHGDDTSMGFNIGTMIELSGSARLGVHYRSKVKHLLEGAAEFTNVPAPFAAAFPNQTASAPLTLPERFSVSFYYDLSPTLAFTADWAWWKWSRFQELAIDFSDPATTDVAQPQDWRDVSIYSAGLRWKKSDALTLRAGLALNASPVRSAALRSPRIPDSNRTWACLGASWRFADNLRGDFGFAHLFFSDSTTLYDDGVGHILRGSYSISANLFSAQCALSF
jgi:long-chain fatty acid transport protein